MFSVFLSTIGGIILENRENDKKWIQSCNVSGISAKTDMILFLICTNLFGVDAEWPCPARKGSSQNIFLNIFNLLDSTMNRFVVLDYVIVIA